MGRSRSSIALKQTDPSFRSLIAWPPAKSPVDWTAQFGRKAPLNVEIGFGRGEYLVREAARHPEQDFLGLELTWGAIQAGLYEIGRAKVSNVRLMRCDARVAFDWLFPAESIGQIHVLFPPPWPENRQAKHRLFQSDFLRLLNNRLIQNGRVYLTTDQDWYADWVIKNAGGAGFLSQLQTVGSKLNTHYERKWSSRGQQFFYQLTLKKQTHEIWPKKKGDLPMLSAVVSGFNPQRFYPQNQEGIQKIGFKEFLYDPDRGRAMLRTVIAEEALVQDFWIDFTRRESDWVIRPALGCHVMPTQGTRRAFELAAEAARSSATHGQNKLAPDLSST